MNIKLRILSFRQRKAFKKFEEGDNLSDEDE